MTTENLDLNRAKRCSTYYTIFELSLTEFVIHKSVEPVRPNSTRPQGLLTCVGECV